MRYAARRGPPQPAAPPFPPPRSPRGRLQPLPMSRHSRHNFGNLYRWSLFGILATVLSLLGTFWIIHEYLSYTKTLDRMRDESLAARKAEIAEQVNSNIASLRFRISKVEERIRQDLRTQTDNAWGIADNLFRHEIDRLGKQRTEQLIVTALMPLRAFDGQGYCWIVDTNHTVVAHPFRRALLGKNGADLTDLRGQKFIRSFVRAALSHPEGGFVSYYWNKQGNPPSPAMARGEKKIAFMRLFAPLNWVIGTGEYVPDMERQLQQEALVRLNALRFDDNGYIFVHTFDGTCLAHVRPENIGLNRWNLTSGSGRKLVQEIIRTGRQPNGGFLEYMASVDPGTGQPGRKISYVKSLDEWQWVLGAGFYLHDIDAKVAVFRASLMRDLRDRVLTTLLILAVALAASYWVSRLLSQQITGELNLFNTFFLQAADRYAPIDEEKLSIAEFRDLAGAANRMIEERQHILADLQRSEEQWAKSFNAITDVVTIQDLDHRILKINDAACRLLGLPPQEIIGKYCYEIFQADSFPCPHCPGALSLADGGSHANFITHTRLGKTFAVSTAPTFDSGGRIEHLVHVAKDITQQRQLEEKLFQARKMEAIGTLAGGIAHDFNNILTSLLGYAEMAEEDLKNGALPLDYIQQVIIAANRGGELVKRILTFSRSTPQALAPLNPAPVIRESLKLLRAIMPSSVKIEEDLSADGAILADSTKLHQIMVNLGTNALHAMENQRGTLRVALRREEPTPAASRPAAAAFLELTVSDTGHGIYPEHLAHIFEPYFTTKEVGKGIGMGLAVVHGLVTEFGGTIKVESESGHGTTFRLQFPIVAASPKPSHEQPDPPPALQGKERILVVDDEESITRMLQQSLERFGYQVTARNDSVAALADFLATPDAFDLLIVDQTMPDLDGAGLAKAALARRPQLPIILCTGYSSVISKQEALAMGIRYFLLKPVDGKLLAAAIRDLLDGGGPTAAAGPADAPTRQG